MYQIIDEKIIGRKVDTSDFLQLKVVHIVCDTAASVPEPLPEWAAGSHCDVLADSGTVYILSISGEWKQVNFYNRGGGGGDFDPDSYYTKPQTDARITEKVAEIVADAPEDFDTLKEMSDWISQHEESAAAMNTAIQRKVDKVAGKGLSTNDYTTEEKTKLSGIEAGANKTVVDSALNSSSTNPVQNKVIKESLDNKVDKVTGKGLSTNDFTNADKTKLSGIEEGATKTIVDTDLSSTSTNPVQNKAVKAALDSKADATAMSVVGLRLVASDVLTSNTAYTYQMSKNDFDKSELGTYIISIVTWSTTPKYSLYAVSYTGNTIFRNLVVKIAGDDMTVTVEEAVISVSGFPSNGGKISIHALQ